MYPRSVKNLSEVAPFQTTYSIYSNSKFLSMNWEKYEVFYWEEWNFEVIEIFSYIKVFDIPTLWNSQVNTAFLVQVKVAK